MSDPASRPAQGQAVEVFWTGPQGGFVGLSTDTKPTTKADGKTPLVPGLQFFEYDTKNRYEWTGVSWQWKVPTDPEADPTLLLRRILAVQEEMLAELRRLRLGMVFADSSVCTDVDEDLTPSDF